MQILFVFATSRLTDYADILFFLLEKCCCSLHLWSYCRTKYMAFFFKKKPSPFCPPRQRLHYNQIALVV